VKDDWRRRDAVTVVQYIKSTIFSFQSGEEITTTTQAERTEGDRLLTYVYRTQKNSESNPDTVAAREVRRLAAPASDDKEDPDDK
jgi:hypothetical protein